MSYAMSKMGKRVRFLPDFYINRLVPQADWEGTIVEVRESLAGQTTIYKVRLDERFQSEHAKDEEMDAKDEEMEEL